MAVWRYAGSLDDIWAGEMRAVHLGAVGVLLCNVDGTLVAYEDRCPHLANPLSDGRRLATASATCAAHEWEFDARTGRGVEPGQTLAGGATRCDSTANGDLRGRSERTNEHTR